jgi:hypothetical protein
MEAIVREMRASARCRDRRRAVRCSCRTQSRCLATCVFLPARATRHGGVAAGRSRRSSAGAGPVVGTALYADCALDQCLEHVMIDVVETLEVQAPFADLVRAELVQELWITILNAANEVHDEVCLAR